MPARGALVKGACALHRTGLGMIGARVLRPHASSTGLRLFRSCSARLDAGHPSSDAPAPLLPGLHIVGTPIGNLQDLSPRALAVLRQCDKILCEDTRHTRHLCTSFGITTPLESLHEHNEAAKCKKVTQTGCFAAPTTGAAPQSPAPHPSCTPPIACQVVGMLEAGAALALVSDAGMPCVSDPGSRLVAAVAAAGLSVSVIPGAWQWAGTALGAVWQGPRCDAWGRPRSGHRQRGPGREGGRLPFGDGRPSLWQPTSPGCIGLTPPKHTAPAAGPSAMLSAVAVSGFDTSKLYFAGFLPAKGTARRRELEQLRGGWAVPRGTCLLVRRVGPGLCVLRVLERSRLANHAGDGRDAGLLRLFQLVCSGPARQQRGLP